MSTENITKFYETASADPNLAAKIQSLKSEPPNVAAEKLCALAAERGFSITPEEIAAVQAGQLTDEALESVAGGISSVHVSAADIYNRCDRKGRL